MAGYNGGMQDSDIIANLRGFNRTFVGVWTSCTDPNAPFWDTDPTYVANSLDGYYIEYEKTFQSATTMGGRTNSGTTTTGTGEALPYSTILRPVVSLERLFQAERVWFDGAMFTVMDAMKYGSTYQNADNNDAIINSISSTNYGAWNASRWLNGAMCLSGVNYFRPGITYNDGGTILDMLSTQIQVNGTSNLGDQSVGPDLPFWVPGGYELGDQVTNLNVYGGAAQYINGDPTAPLVRYPIKATLYFRLKGTT